MAMAIHKGHFFEHLIGFWENERKLDWDKLECKSVPTFYENVTWEYFY